MSKNSKRVVSTYTVCSEPPVSAKNSYYFVLTYVVRDSRELIIVYCIYCNFLMYVLVILLPPDPTCCARPPGNCVELLYGTLTDPSLHNSTMPLSHSNQFYLYCTLVHPSLLWLSYTVVPLLYPSVPFFIVAQLYCCTSTVP